MKCWAARTRGGDAEHRPDGPGSQDYYLGAVAHGVEDYYLGRGEAAGRWLGRGLEPLGLNGRVDAAELNAVLAGQDPASGERLARHPARQVPGFDLTFRAPKSVSLLWALGNDQVAAQVQAAHDAAVDAAIGYLERDAARTRRGAQGAERVGVDGFIGAAFRHRTSRAGDPLLHTHVLVANLARTSDDGVWRTLDSRALFTHARTAGFLYQAHLRHELTRTLGVGWEPVVNGTADLAGVDRAWIDAFSQRRQAILAELDARGETSARAAQVATLATRQGKEAQADEPTLRQRWRTRADEHGVDPDRWNQLLGQHSVLEVHRGRLFDELVGPEGLTEQASTFDRRDLLRAVAERLPDGGDIRTIEDIADRLLHYGLDRDVLVGLDHGRGHLAEVIRREDGSVVPTGEPGRRFTTRELLLVEQEAADGAVRAQHEGLAQVSQAALRTALSKRPTLTDEQAAMVARLTTSGAGVEVVVGKAGTGKTFALDAARDALTASGVPVTGVSLAARAALELEESSGIAATTLAKLEAQVRDHRAGSPLQPGQVLVVDEAGMVGTRQLARVLRHARQQRVKVVLVGDPHQLPEIDAGGLFRALANRLPAVELSDNRRQQHRWEVNALDHLRDGEVGDAVSAYRDQGRIVTSDTAEAIRERLVTDWWETSHHLAADQAVMVALRRGDVDDLNRRARERMRAAGRLTGPALQLSDVEFRAGDRIVCLRNSGPLGVVNGTRATVTDVTQDGALLATDDIDGGLLRLPADYLEAGHVTHGYAITGHKAQGLTVDHTFVLGSDELYREWGYVALSRGRESNRLYLHEQAHLERDGGPHTPTPVRDPIEAAVQQLSRSRAEAPLSVPPGQRLHDARAYLISANVTEQVQLRKRRSTLAHSRKHSTERLTEIQDRLRQGGLLVTRKARAERADLADEADSLAKRLVRIDDELAEVDARLARFPSRERMDAAQQSAREAAHVIASESDRRVRRATVDPPPYLVATLGEPPRDTIGRDRWRRAAKVIESYRVSWGITHPTAPLGEGPTSPVQADDHTHAVAELDRLARPQGRELARDLSRGLSR